MSEDKPKNRKKRASSNRRSPRYRDIKLTAFAIAIALENDDTKLQAREKLISAGCLEQGYNNLLTAVALFCTKSFGLNADPVEIGEIRSWISQENRKIRQHNNNHENQKEASYKSIKEIPSLKDKLKDPTPADIVAEKNAEVDRMSRMLHVFIGSST